jgi:hypothetical protein
VQNVGMSYRALRDIAAPGASAGTFAYRQGQLVHESAVTGDGAWLTLGADVEPVEGADPAAPARDAPASAWEAFLAARGFDRGQLAAMGRDQMVAAYDSSQAPPAAEPAGSASSRRRAAPADSGGTDTGKEATS